MAIASHHPETGVRLVLERPRDGGPPFRYEGEAFTPDARFTMRATLDAQGAVKVTLEGCPDATLTASVTEKAKFILRAAFKHATADGMPPPRRIVRWRGEK